MARFDRPGSTAAVLMLLMFLSTAMCTLPLPDERDAHRPAASLDVAYNASIQVLVIDNAGRAIGGADVALLGTTQQTKTNDSGYAMFTDLLADSNGTSYNLSAEKLGYNPSGVTEAIATPGNVTSVELEIFGGLILGTVTEGTTPIVGALVSISSLGYSNITGTDGSYRLNGVPGNPFPYAVSAVAEGYVNQTLDVMLETGGVAVLDFFMSSRTGSISGTVTHATTDEPLLDVNVSIRLATVTVTVSTGTDGTYIIPDLPSGTYTVTASLDGFETATVADVVVASGVDHAGVDFPLVEKPTKLYGSVGAGTILLPGVLISVEGTDLSTTSTVNGSWAILNITAGTYNVVATLEGYIPTIVVGVVIPRGGEKRLDINLEGLPGSLHGVVISSNTKAALSGVEVTIVGGTTLRSTITNVNGEFEFTGLAAGDYTVRFLMDDYKPREIGPITMTPEGTVTLDNVLMEPITEGFGGFIFGFDLAHSMMILALLLTIVILAVAVILRIRAFEEPDRAPAVLDQEDEPQEGEQKEVPEEAPAGNLEQSEPERQPDNPKKKQRKTKKS